MTLIIHFFEIVKFERREGPGLVHHGLDGKVEVGVGPPAKLYSGPSNCNNYPPSPLLC